RCRAEPCTPPRAPALPRLARALGDLGGDPPLSPPMGRAQERGVHRPLLAYERGPALSPGGAGSLAALGAVDVPAGIPRARRGAAAPRRAQAVRPHLRCPVLPP